MAADGAVKVHGLRELNRAFGRADKTLQRELGDAMKDAAAPVRSDAEALATSSIKVAKIPWQEMRVGVTQRMVYVAPKQRPAKLASRKRKKFAQRLMDRAMQPALDANRGEVVRKVEHVLDTVGRAWER